MYFYISLLNVTLVVFLIGLIFILILLGFFVFDYIKTVIISDSDSDSNSSNID